MRILISILFLSIACISIAQPPKKVDNRRGSSEAVARSIIIYGFRLPIQDTVCDLLNYNDTLGCIGSMVYKPEDGNVYVKKTDKWEVFALGAITESDPIFSAAAAAGISTLDIMHWNSAYSWGNHSIVGYLLSSTAAATYQPIGTYATASNAMNFTNKTGNISQWTNDAGYATTGALSGLYVPLTRTITINGTTQDLSANRTYTIANISGNAATATLASTVTTNANLTGPITSVGNATAIASQTGTGSTFVVQNTPTLTTPNIGVATGTSLTLGSSTGGGKIALPDAGTTFSDGITFGTDLRMYRASNQALRLDVGNVGRYLEITPSSGSTVLTAKGTTTDALTLRANSTSAVATVVIGNTNQNVVIQRNTGDANPLFTLTQTHASATGDIIQFANSGGTVGYITRAGYHYSPIAPQATANAGVWNIGNGPFDGTTTGFFNGISTGTFLAINAFTSYSGNFAEFQTMGISRLKINSAGFVGIACGTGAPAAVIDANSTSTTAEIRIANSSTGTGSSNGFFLGNTSDGHYEVWSKNANRIKFGINNTEVMGLTANGLYVGGSGGITSAGIALEVNSTTKTFMLPRMTTAQRNAITGINGMEIFCTDCIATDGSTGVSQTFSSSSWRNHY